MEHTICEQQNRVVVFANDAGGISIKEVCWPDDDQVVAIPLSGVEALIAALRAAEKDAVE